MKIFWKKLFPILALFAGCSDGGRSSGPGRVLPGDGFASDPLSYTNVSRTLLSEQNYYVSYSQSSGRLGIIDADSFKEIWGSYTSKNIPYVFNLPGHEGAGLVSADGLEIVIREGSRSFPLPRSKADAWNRARESITVVAYDSDSKKVHAVKYRGETNWESVEINPFASGESFSESGAVVVGLTGKLALVVGATSASYSIIEDQSGKLVSSRTCVNSGMPSTVAITSAAIDEEQQTAFFAVGPDIYQVDLKASGSCTPPDTWTKVFSGTNKSSRIGMLSANQLFSLAQKPGKLQLFEIQPGTLARTAEIDTVCEEPAGANAFGSVYFAVICAHREINQFNGEETSSIDYASIKFLDQAGSLGLTRTLRFSERSGIVFNPGNKEFFEVYDSAAGEVKVHSVPSGAVRTIEGIYLGGILNRL